MAALPNLNNIILKWRKKGDTVWINQITLPSNQTNFSLDNLDSNTDYEVCVITDCGETQNQLIKEFKTDKEICTTPTDLNITPEYNTANITWNDIQPPHHDTYNIKLFEGANLSQEANTTALIYNLTGLNENTNYTVEVKSICSYNESDKITKTFKTKEKSCAEPLNLTLSTPDKNSILVLWDININPIYSNPINWFIQWNNNDWTSFGSYTSNINSYLITDLIPYTDYTITVKTNCSNGTESNTITNWIKTPTDPPCNNPISLTLINNTQSSLTFLIDNNEEGGLDITGNLIYYNQIGVPQIELITNSNPFTLTNLNPNTLYEVTVYNKCGNETSAGLVKGQFTTSKCQSCESECLNCGESIPDNLGELINKPTVIQDNDINKWVITHLIKYPKEAGNCFINEINNIDMIPTDKFNFIYNWSVYAEDLDFYYIEIISHHNFTFIGTDVTPPPSQNEFTYNGFTPCELYGKNLIQINY